MLRSVPSSPDTNDGHLRALLDQRTARADPLDRYSTLSQLSDTPSVYSRPYFSPRAPNRPELDNDHHYDQQYDPRSTRQRLQDPNVSTLDLGDDRRSSPSTSDAHDDEPHSFEDPNDDELGDRMSYLGPKMRIHTRAPWEMEAEALQEEDELVGSPKTFGLPFSFGGGHRSASSPTTSPRPSNAAGRPSGDSYRSHVPPKRSFETINSQLSARGALYTLAQESLSATSLARVSGPAASKDTFLGKLSSLGRPRAPTLSSATTPVSTPSSPNPSSSPVRSPRRPHPNLTIMHDIDTNQWPTNRDSNHTRYGPSSYSANESVHPYANPDLIVTCDEPDPIPPASPTFSLHPSLTRGGPATSVMQSFGSTDPDAMPRNGPRTRSSTIHGKGISSPLTVQGSAIPSNFSANIVTAPSDQPAPASHLPGWTERVVPPTFNLISLEEARAQRARNSTLPDELQRSVSSTSNAVAASQSTVTLTQEDVDAQSFSASGAFATRSRGRTISAGAKAKTAIQNIVGAAKYDRRDSEPAVVPTPVSQPAGKPLKHKKSGFMRLFNGGKEKDEGSLPPVPPISMAYSEPGSNSKKSVNRVPVPSYFSDNYAASVYHREADPFSPDPRPSPPPLQLHFPTTHTRGTGSDGDKVDNTLLLPQTKPWMDQPQSAPPDMSSFPPLRLRPVSTLFSSHFEHFVPDLQSNAHDRMGSETPTTSSPNEPVHPLTPGATDGFSKGDENPSVTIHLLREQLASAKLASQRQIWELEGQIKDLKLEVEQLRSRQAELPTCDNCNRRTWSSSPSSVTPPSSEGNTPSSGKSVLNRPRAKTGTNARFVNAYS